MLRGETNADAAAAIGLGALAWVIGDEARAERFLSLSGIDAATLRARANDPRLLAAVLGHLEAHEPDLIACADALELPPAALVAARTTLETA